MRDLLRRRRLALPGFLVALLLLWLGQTTAEQAGTPLMAAACPLTERLLSLNDDPLPLSRLPGAEENDTCLCLNERSDDDSSKERARANSGFSFPGHKPLAIGTRRLHRPATANNAYRLTAVYLLTQRFRL